MKAGTIEVVCTSPKGKCAWTCVGATISAGLPCGNILINIVCKPTHAAELSIAYIEK